jgi:glycosyltransferase involved in cell wall biosynthesis
VRILICSFTFSPQANGVAEVVREQATGLAACGHEVTVATEFDPRRATAAALPGVRVREFKIKAGPRGKPGPSGEVTAYQDFVAKADVDLILCHCWSAWPTDLAIPVLPRNRARKLFVSHGFDAHMWKPQSRFPWGLGQWLRQQPYVWGLPRKMRAFDHIVFLSHRSDRARFFDHWLRNRFGGPDWSVIPNGTWPEKFAKGQSDFRLQHGMGDRFLILNVGLYAVTKGQETSLRVFSESGIADATLVFIGNELNEFAGHLRQLATRLPFGTGSSVLFLEKQNRENIRAAYQAADLFLLTSKGETQPLVLLDAMACGCPFLSTDVGCVAELPGGVTVQHPAGLVETLRLLQADSNRLAALGQLGLAAAQSAYHWPKVVADYDQLIRRLVAHRPKQA